MAGERAPYTFTVTHDGITHPAGGLAMPSKPDLTEEELIWLIHKHAEVIQRITNSESIQSHLNQLVDHFTALKLLRSTDPSYRRS